jgi:diguanylate cyclase (GGDEF)-like protein
MLLLLAIAFSTARELRRTDLAIAASTSALRVQDALDRELRLLRTDIGDATRAAERGNAVSADTWAKLDRRLDLFAKSVERERDGAPEPTRAAIERVDALSHLFLISARKLVFDAARDPSAIKPDMPDFLGRLRAVEDARIQARDVLTAHLAERADAAAHFARIWQTTLALCGAIFISTMLGFSAWLLRAVVLPLRHLADAAEKDNVDERIAAAAGRCDEVGALARSVVALTNMTEERREMLERAEYAAHHDPLTGLQNRRSFEGRLEAAITGIGAGEELALLYIDLDGFKEVNDRLGHATGDQLLQDVAAVLCRVVGDPAWIGRMGGDEFSIIQTGEAQPAGASDLASRLLGAFDAWRASSRLAVGASIGIAVHPRDGQTPTRLRHSADLALYSAKHQGRGRARHFSADLAALEASTQRVPLSAELPSAIRHGDLRLFYQPKRRTCTGKADSLEALVRWQHPVRGLVSPADFVPLAERTGQIRALTDWTLRRAVADQARLQRAGLELPVFVNISGALLSDGEFVNDALQVLRSRSGEIGLEVTETAVIADPRHALAHLNMFVDEGLRVSIDDYGTGMSSLAYLKPLPATELKIDRTFIAGISHSQRDQLIVKSTIDLAHALGLEVTAEGVETAADEALLEIMGCDLVQGYVVAAPMPLDEIVHASAAGSWSRQAAQRERSSGT